MSLGAAFHNASSGLTVALRAVGATSSNLANALTENYGKRGVTIASRIDGGARITGMTRLVDQRIQGQIWLSNARSSGSEITLRGMGEIERLLGALDEPTSLYELATRFETSLISLASRPDDSLRQANANAAAADLAAKFRAVGRGIQEIRENSEKRLSNSVSRLNSLLDQIEDLNGSIVKSHGMNTAGLEDERQALVDEVSGIIPVKLVDRSHGRIALMTPKGQFLLDQSAAKIGFEAAGVITSSHSVEDGLLAVPTLNGGVFHMPATGEMSSLLALRDQVTTSVFDDLTRTAEALVTSLSTIGASEPLFGFANSTPMATELEFTGDFAQNSPSDTLAAMNAAAPKFTSQISTLSSRISTSLLESANRLSSANAKQAALRELKATDAVDTDAELQNLISIEKIYTANAKALQVVGNMLDDLLKIG